MSWPCLLSTRGGSSLYVSLALCLFTCCLPSCLEVVFWLLANQMTAFCYVCRYLRTSTFLSDGGRPRKRDDIIRSKMYVCTARRQDSSLMIAIHKLNGSRHKKAKNNKNAYIHTGVKGQLLYTYSVHMNGFSRVPCRSYQLEHFFLLALVEEHHTNRAKTKKKIKKKGT